QWTLIAGYHGRTGEIDRILIGPYGVFAFEIKGNRGVINANANGWWVERYDRHGTLINAKQLPRAPDAQLEKATASLQQWLKRNGIHERISRIVLFAAEDAALGRIEHSRADWVVTLRGLDLGRLFLSGPHASDGEHCDAEMRERIVGLVLKDHKFNAARQRKPAPPVCSVKVWPPIGDAENIASRRM
ncbi:MAG: nuclease-related domain-containing protein, partial [Rhodocyclaceae bacterium]